MKTQAELVDSLAEINRVDRAETAKKKSNEVEMLTLAAPAAVKKYREKGYDANKLTKVELASVYPGIDGCLFYRHKPKAIEESLCRGVE